jgi:hypothetical protein
MHVRSIALVIALVFGLVAIASAGKASKVERKFGGKILLSDKKFPSAAKSEGAYISKLQRQKRIKFWENKATKEWKIHFAAFFKRPLADLEYTIKIYDVSGGSQQLLTSFEQYTDSSDQRSLLSYLILDRKSFGVNKRLMMTIESQGRVVAAAKFQILGEAERFKGKVDFSEEEAAAGSND